MKDEGKFIRSYEPAPAARVWNEDLKAEAHPLPARRDPDDTCWCCAGRTVKRHCKIVCTNCGFMRDCSDP